MERSGLPLVVRNFGLVEYRRTLEAMRAFTETRAATTTDELWLLQHPPVYTRGVRAAPSPRVSVNPRFAHIPVVATDRGGLMTYHGPGQLIAYPLLDLRRAALGARALVNALEQGVIACLAGYGLNAARRARAPGVYVEGAKIAALGLRVRRAASYHGLSLNVDMDLAPFGAIDPCGHAGLAVTQLAALHPAPLSPEAVAARLAACLATALGFVITETVAACPEPPQFVRRGR